MRQEYSIVIADTSCFILLDKIHELELLRKIFATISTTQEIAAEFNKPLPEWITIRTVLDKHYQSILETDVDKGEASAIALAVETKDSLLILDDAKARRLADTLKLPYTGTLGIVLKAKEEKIIHSILPILEKIQLTNFRFSEKVMNEILRDAGE